MFLPRNFDPTSPMVKHEGAKTPFLRHFVYPKRSIYQDRLLGTNVRETHKRDAVFAGKGTEKAPVHPAILKEGANQLKTTSDRLSISKHEIASGIAPSV
jgi:hypothetical protein